MNQKIDWHSDRFAVIGLGETGLSIINYLNFKQAKIVKVFDTRTNPPHQDMVKNYESHYGELAISNFDEVDIIVISPGISIYDKVLQLAITMGKQVIGDIELFAEAIKAWPNTKIIGITGSNGKTTVTTLTGHLITSIGLKVLVAGNIGLPVLQSYIEACKSNDIPDVVVLELSSFQLESIYSLALDCATCLNISEDHLDRYRDLLEYSYTKSNIFSNCRVQVLNIDDDLVMAMSREKLNKNYFGLNNNCVNTVKLVDSKNYLYINNNKYLACEQLQVLGMHNYLNILASLLLLAGAGFDINSEAIKDGLRSFKSVSHRMEKILTHKGVTYIDDSKGTNVGAVIAGVKGLDLPVHLILGGDGKGQDFHPLRELVKNKCRSVAIIGQDAGKIYDVLLDLSLPINICNTLEDAVSLCIQSAKSNEYVVLSPACASWDMFDNYKHRAQVFKDSVYAYTK